MKFFSFPKYSLRLVLLFSYVAYAFSLKSQIIEKQKSLAIFNLANSFSWPEIENGSIQITILNNLSLENEMRELAKSRKIDNKTVIIQNKIISNNFPQIIYANQEYGFSSTEIIDKIDSRKTLFMGENYLFNESMVNILFVNDELFYDLNESKLKFHGFVIPNYLKEASIKSSEKWFELYQSSLGAIVEKEKLVASQEQTIKNQITRLKGLSSEIETNQKEINDLKIKLTTEKDNLNKINEKQQNTLSALTKEEAKINRLQFEMNEKSELLIGQTILRNKLDDSIQLKRNELKEIHNQMDKKQQEIQAQKNEIKGKNSEISNYRRVNILFVLVIVLSLTVISGVLYEYKRHKRSNELLSKKNEEIQQFLEESKQFSYIASHDLQAPLTTINGFAHLLKESCQDNLDDKRKLYLNYIIESSVGMQTMITDLLNFSKIGLESPFEIIDFNELIDTIIRDFGFKIENGKASVVTNIHQKNIQINVQKYEFKMLIQNLIGNAIKFSPQEQKAIVHIDALVLKKESKNYLRVEIKDFGIGIEDKYKEQIFKIFTRLHSEEEYSGTGIGLATALKVVKKHDGKIWIEDNPKGGSIFIFEIPIV